MIPFVSRRSPVYVGTGGVATYAFAFKVFAAGDVLVQRTDTSNVESTLVLNTDYSVSLNGDQDSFPGGTITLLAGNLATGFTLVVIGDQDYSQTTQLPTGGAYNAVIVEKAIDRVVVMAQQLKEKLDRALIFAASDTNSPQLSNASTRALKGLVFDADGNPQMSAELYSLSAALTAAEASAATAAAQVASLDARLPISYTGVIFGWNSDAGLSGARFPAFAEIGPGKLWASYSPRNVFTNDGELDMRLDVVELTYNDAAQAISVGAPTTIATPVGFGTGKGAIWSCGFHVISSGPNKGRKIIVAQELNSPDGTYANPASRYDVVLYYTDAVSVAGPWTRVLLLSGETAHTSFGLADYNAAQAGMHVPSGNCIVEMPDGRLVIVGYLPAPGNGYLCSLYTDNADGITGWTAGTALAYPNAGDNEPSVALASDGLRVFVRNESVNKRSTYTSTDGATFTYSRAATDVPIRNVANCAVQTSTGRIYVGGATTVTATGAGGVATADNRRGWKLYPSDNDGATFGAGFALFEEPQRIGYSCLRELSDGTYGLMFEVTSTQTGESFNQKPGLGFARFNRQAIEGVLAGTLPLHDGLRFTASEEYDAYAAYVTGDGGTIQSAADTLAAITSAISGNYYSKIGRAVSGRWGHKNLGAVGPVLYSLNRTKNSGSVLNGTIDLDTTTYAFPVVSVPNGAEFTFGATAIHLGDTWGAVFIDKTSDTGAGGGMGFQWTNSVAHYVFVGGTAYFGANVVTGSPNYGITAGDSAHFFFDMKKRVAFAGLNGVDRQAPMYFPKYSTNGQTVSVRLHPVAGGAGRRHMAEAWLLNGTGVTTAMVRQLSADGKARS